MLKEKFLNLIEEIKRINHPVIKFLNNPIGEKVLTNFNREFPVFRSLDSELFDIFYIHNGTNLGMTDNVDQLHLVSNYFFNSIENIKEILESGDYNLLSRGHFPLFSSGFGEYLTLNIAEMSSGLINSKVYLVQSYDPTIEEIISIYDNLYSLFETGIQCYKTGVISKENDEINIDIDREYEISGELNPNSDFWKHK
jgi:hypothetical protein